MQSQERAAYYFTRSVGAQPLSLSASSPGFIDFCEKGPFIASTRA